jgi:rare lipoprotein A
LVKRRTWLSPLLVVLSILPVTETQALVSDGVASYYGRGFDGRRTASGERFDMNNLTAAHRTLSFGTRVMVTNKANGRSVEVTINDRGPYIGGRTIDLSKGAAREIGMLGSGVARVELQVLNVERDYSSSSSTLAANSTQQQMMMDLF